MNQYDALAKVYDVLSDDVDVGAWVSYLASFFDRADTGIENIADVGCGTGRFSVALSNMGYSVVGVDSSVPMLDAAAKNARRAGQQIRFVQQDAAALDLPQQDAILAICDVVNHLSPAQAEGFFLRAFEHLSPGGVLLFDISSQAKLHEMIANQFYYEDREEITYFWENHAALDMVHMELTFFLKQDNGQYYVREDIQIDQHIHSEQALLQLLKKAGFTVQSYVFLGDTAPDNTAQRIQFVAQK